MAKQKPFLIEIRDIYLENGNCCQRQKPKDKIHTRIANTFRRFAIVFFSLKFRFATKTQFIRLAPTFTINKTYSFVGHCCPFRFSNDGSKNFCCVWYAHTMQQSVVNFHETHLLYSPPPLSFSFPLLYCTYLCVFCLALQSYNNNNNNNILFHSNNYIDDCNCHRQHI